MNEQELVELFQKLGARDAAGWAHSQLSEGIPQVARFLFLREAWKLVVQERSRDWIREQMNADPGRPGGAIGPALRRMIAHGVWEEDLTTVVRVMQWRLLSALCYLLEGPGNTEDEVRQIGWRLFQVDQTGRPTAVMAGLHESVLGTDPAGREMRT